MASSLTNVLVEKTPVKNDQGQTVMQTVSYTYGLGPVAQSGGGITEYLLADGLGSVRQYTSGTGDVLRSQTFDPYGNRYEWRQSDAHWAIASPFGWTGEQSDPNGLTYLRARYYAPSMGRFTQLDPFAGALAVPASMNGYGYAHGSPTMYTDPSGQCIWDGCLLEGALIVAGLAFIGTYIAEAHQNSMQGMDFWQATYYQNINWGHVGRNTAIGAGAGLAAGCIFSPYVCALLLARGFALLETYDAVDDALTYALAAQGDPEAAAQIAVMNQVSPFDGPNSLVALSDDVVEAFGSARRAIGRNLDIGASFMRRGDDIVNLSPATGRFPDEVTVRPGGPMFRDSPRSGRTITRTTLSRPWAKNTMSPWARTADARANLMEVWDIPTPQVKANGDTLWEAHHIVAQGIDYAEPAQMVLRKHNIDLDSPANLVWLPGYSTDVGIAARYYDPVPLAHHGSGIHTTVNPPVGRTIPNVERVNRLLMGLDRAGASRGQIILMLNEIGNSYLRGVLP